MSLKRKPVQRLADSLNPMRAAELSRGRRFTFALAAVLGSLALSFGVLEVAFRLLDVDLRPLPLRRLEVLEGDTWRSVGTWGTAPLKRPSPYPNVSIGEFIPNSTFRFVYFDRPRSRRAGSAAAGPWETRTVVGHINRYGLRGPAVDLTKPPGTFRILILGDSFTFGAGVADDEPFAAKLETLLNEGRVGNSFGRRYETINAGVSGYNTMDEVTYLQKRWLAFDPDLILLTFYLNDAYDDARFAPLIMGGAIGETLGAPALLSRSRVMEWATNAWKRWWTARRIKHIYRSQFSDTPEIEGHNWKNCQEALAQAAAISEERGIRLALVIFPELYELNKDYPFRSIHARVREAGEMLGIPVLDLIENFQGHDPTKLWVHITDHHPNALAHATAAHAIARFLVNPSHGLLEAGPAPAGVR